MRDWNKVYELLEVHAGADMDQHYRSAFVSAHERGCEEYRFCGYLGFGGKYRSERNVVDCYPEDMNEGRREVIERTNAALAAMEVRDA